MSAWADAILGLTTMDEGCFVRSPLNRVGRSRQWPAIGSQHDTIVRKFRMFDYEHHPWLIGGSVQEPGARIGRTQAAL